MKDVLLATAKAEFDKKMVLVRQNNNAQLAQIGEDARKAAIENAEREIASDIVAEYEKAVKTIESAYAVEVDESDDEDEEENDDAGESPNE